MGSVYEVEETSVEKLYVLKVIHPHLLHGSGSRVQARMQKEAKTLAKLEHKNIVQVYWAGVTDEVLPLPYYVMERLSGYTLRHITRWHRSKGRLMPLGRAFRIASSLVSALGYAHENGIVHRDVKPDNIFLHQSRDGKPLIKLLDFGIMAVVSELSDEKRLTAGGFTGTYTHAAPEQLRGEKPTAAMDIYASGIVLYEMLAGRHPFEDWRVPTALVAAHLHESPPPLGPHRPLDPRLERLVLSMLSKDPSERPEAGEIVSTLQHIRSDWTSDDPQQFAHDATELQFDEDMGQLYVTNVGDEDSSSEGWTQRSARTAWAHDPSRGPSSKTAGSSLAGVPPLELFSEPELPGGAVPTRGTWGQTVEVPSRRSRRVLVPVGAVAVLALIAGTAWKVLRREEPSDGKAHVSSAIARSIPARPSSAVGDVAVSSRTPLTMATEIASADSSALGTASATASHRPPATSARPPTKPHPGKAATLEESRSDLLAP